MASNNIRSTIKYKQYRICKVCRNYHCYSLNGERIAWYSKERNEMTSITIEHEDADCEDAKFEATQDKVNV